MENIKRSEGKFIFSVSNSKEVWKKCRKSLINARYSSGLSDKYLLKAQSVMIGYFNYYSMTTRMDWFCDRIVQFLYKRQNNWNIKKIDGKGEFFKDDIVIQPWIMRSKTKDSIKDYVKSKPWKPFDDDTKSNNSLTQYINSFIAEENNYDMNSYKVFIPGLLNVYKKEPILGIPYQEIAPQNLHVHHVVPKRLGGKTEFSNLVVITNESHKLIHNENYEPKFEDKYWKVNEQKLRKYRRKVK